MATPHELKIDIRIQEGARRRLLYGGPHDGKIVDTAETMVVLATKKLRDWTLHEEIEIGVSGRVIYYARDVYDTGVACSTMPSTTPNMKFFAVAEADLEEFDESKEREGLIVEIPQRIKAGLEALDLVDTRTDAERQADAGEPGGSS